MWRKNFNINSYSQFHIRSHEKCKNDRQFFKDHLVQPPNFTDVETERNYDQFKVTE